MPQQQITRLAEQLCERREQLDTMVPAQTLATLDAYAESLGQRTYPAALREGTSAPPFALPNQIGEIVRLQDLLAHGPVVLTFYRGHWCPFCNVQLHEYQGMLPDLAARHAQLVAISPQTPDNSLTMVERHALTFQVLSDVGSRVAEQFGIVFTLEGPIRQTHTDIGANLEAINGDATWRLPVPATYVLKPDGVIAAAWIDGDFRNRAEPGEILAALDAIC